jgi:predicted MPP superfamily phosphohydrolase
MFRTLMFAAPTLLLAYVLCRASTVPAVARRIRRRHLLLSGGILCAGFAVPGLVGRDDFPILSFLTETVATHLFAVLFIVGTSLLAVDLLTGFGLLFRRAVPTLRGAALGAGVVLSSFALVQGTRAPVITPVEVRLPGLPPSLDGTVVAALSDLHVGGLVGGRWLRARVAQTVALRPDLIVLLGDIVEGHGAPDSSLLPVLRGLSAPLGVWAVTGNHESHGPADAGALLLRNAGVKLLRDEAVAATPGLVIAGVDDRGHGTRRGQGDQAAARTLGNRPPGGTIYLSHQPVGASGAAASGAGLMLSGHTHGGQIWPFRYLVGLTTPYVAGRYMVGGMTLFVSRGTGSWGPRMRLFRPGEILSITLRSL